MLNINYFNFNLVKQNERKIYQQQKHEKLNNESQKKKQEKTQQCSQECATLKCT